MQEILSTYPIKSNKEKKHLLNRYTDYKTPPGLNLPSYINKKSILYPPPGLELPHSVKKKSAILYPPPRLNLYSVSSDLDLPNYINNYIYSLSEPNTFQTTPEGLYWSVYLNKYIPAPPDYPPPKNPYKM